MYRIFITVILVLPSIASIVAAYLLAIKDVANWGWFLVIGFLLGVGAFSTANTNNKSNQIGD